MIKGFLLGLITGATTFWVLKDSVATRIDDRTRIIRTRTAQRLHAAAEAIEKGLTGPPAARTPDSGP